MLNQRHSTIFRLKNFSRNGSLGQSLFSIGTIDCTQIDVPATCISLHWVLTPNDSRGRRACTKSYVCFTQRQVL